MVTPNVKQCILRAGRLQAIGPALLGARSLALFNLTHQLVIFVHDIVPIFYLVVKFFDKFVPLGHQLLQGLVLLLDSVVSLFQLLIAGS
jgi:hypothetical protein